MIREKVLESGSKFQDFQFLVEWKIRRRLERERERETDRQTDRQTDKRESNHGEKNYIF